MLLFSRTSILCLALAALPLAASDARAAPPAKQAQKMLQKKAKGVVKQFRKDATIRRKVLELEIDQIRQDVESGAVTTFAASLLFDALVDYQKEMYDAIRDASDAYRVGFGEALLILQEAGISTADRPTGFFYGDFSTSDSLREDMEKEILAAYPKALKEVKKLAKALDKKADVALTCRLAPPTKYLEWITNPGGSGSSFTPTLLTIDVAVGVSQKGQSGDADFYLGGACEANDGTLQTSISHGSGGGILTTVNPTSDDRWKLVETDRSEGNYAFKVYHSGKTAGGGYVTIGVD
ncbi:MAG: hypothetical protein ACF8XB_02690 [Planctomycetota bacterium JB042]